MDWIIVKNNFPSEIVQFIESVFMLTETRGRVGEKNGIVFYVRSKESNHSVPHIHAEYGEYEISIAIDDQTVLATNIPPKQRKLAVKWVKDNKDKLLNEWCDKTISATSSLTKSLLQAD